MNTVFEYMYRDGANNKRRTDIIVNGYNQQAAEKIAALLDDSNYDGQFIARQVGFPDCFFWTKNPRAIGLNYTFTHDVDHCWHTMEDIVETNQKATDPRTIEQVLEAFEKAVSEGWQEYDPSQKPQRTSAKKESASKKVAV